MTTRKIHPGRSRGQGLARIASLRMALERALDGLTRSISATFFCCTKSKGSINA